MTLEQREEYLRLFDASLMADSAYRNYFNTGRSGFTNERESLRRQALLKLEMHLAQKRLDNFTKKILEEA